MRRKEKRFRPNPLSDRRFIVISFILAILILLANLVNKAVKPISFELAEAYAKETVIGIINECVYEYFEDENVGYSDLVDLSFSPSGMVTAIEYDSSALNRLKIGCSEKIADRLKRFRAAKIKVPIGSLFGNLPLSGSGPRVTVKLAAKAFADSEIRSSLESAGVNQSRHEIVLRVTAEVSLMLPPKTRSFSLTQDYVLAQTVIAGDIPQGNIVID